LTTTPASLRNMGIAGVTAGNVDLVAPPDAPDSEAWRYGLGFPFQVAPGKAGIIADLNIEATMNYGFKNGADVVLFDDLSSINTSEVCPVSRNEHITNPDTGETQLILKSPVVGGFVPLQALRSDGTPHPHAGTGFGLGQAHRLLAGPDDEFVWWATDRYDLLEVYQFRYDGREFHSCRTGVFSQNLDSPLRAGESGWSITTHGMTSAIPDGDDLLLPVIARNGSAASDGVSRWACHGEQWHPVSSTPITGSDSLGEDVKHTAHESILWMEPSLIRDTDGSLLFSARGSDSYVDPAGVRYGCLVQVWRSEDGGTTWQVILRVPEIRLESPVTINKAADGTVYLVSNRFDPDFVIDKKTGRGRENLCIWPLNAQRTGLEAPLVAREAVKEFGPAPASPDPDWYDCWMVDHPNGAVVQLRDGKWHSVLTYRVLHSPLFGSLAIPPAPQSGCYVEEVLSSGEELPAWDFGASCP